MIFGQIDSVTTPTENASGIARIGHKVKFLSDQDNISRRTTQISDDLSHRMVTASFAIFIFLFLDFFKFFLALFTQHGLIQLFKGKIKCFNVFFFLVFRKLGKSLDEIFFQKPTDVVG